MSFEAFDFHSATPPSLLLSDGTNANSLPREIRFGWAVIILFATIFLGFGYFVRLDAAVSASGSVKVAGSRQVVQSSDSGAIERLYVHEGEHVRKGQVLVRLKGGDAEAVERVLASEVIGLEAEQARLLAEQNGALIVAYPVSFATLTDDDRHIADSAIRLQNGIFAGRHNQLHDQHGVLGQQAAQLRARIAGLDLQKQANQRQAALFNDQLEGIRALVSEGYASQNRVRELERAQAALEGDEGNITASAAATREQIAETQMRSLEIGSQNVEVTSDALEKNSAALNDALPKWEAARQALAATQIRATATGQVVDLQVFTVGGVVQPAQRLMDIVPDVRTLVIQAVVSPGDAGELVVGQSAEIRFPTIHDRRLPILTGTVTRVSADDLIDPKTGTHYFTCEVGVPFDKMGDHKILRPGLPAQVMVTLHKRSALEYLLEPLDQAIWRSGTEH